MAAGMIVAARTGARRRAVVAGRFTGTFRAVTLDFARAAELERTTVVELFLAAGFFFGVTASKVPNSPKMVQTQLMTGRRILS